MSMTNPWSNEAKRQRWRFIGYSGASRWMASDSDFFVVRRFDILNTRVILEKQAQIVCMEQKLAEIDDPLRHVNQDNSTVLEDRHPERPQLLQQLWLALKEYNEFISIYSDLKERPLASQHHEVKNVRNWLQTYKGAICPEEASFPTREDLIPIVSKNKTPLRRILEHWGAFCKAWLFRAPKIALPPQSGSAPVEFDQSHYFDDAMVDRFIYVAIVLLGLVMLIVPLWWLDAVSDPHRRLGIITGFILLFALLLGFSTQARPFDTLAAAAGYSAVLMVYMQIQSHAT